MSQSSPKNRFAHIVALSAGVGLLACSSNGDAGSGGSDAATTLPDGDISCSRDPYLLAQPFKVNVARQGDSKQMSFEIVKADTDPPAVGSASWTVKISDPNGKPIADAMLSFPRGSHPSDPWMPHHTHPNSVLPTAINHHDGTYTVEPLYFYMGGVWSTSISAQSGAASDIITFSVCVGG